MEGCWGKCLHSDIIRPTDRQMVENVANALAGEMSDYFSVRPTANLTFQVSEGAYARALQARGYETRSACAVDCETVGGAAVPAGYCNAGFAHGYDAVLSITKPPGVYGVAGTGSACANDNSGRPLWMVFAWHTSIIGIGASSVASKVAECAHIRTERSLLVPSALAHVHALRFRAVQVPWALPPRGPPWPWLRQLDVQLRSRLCWPAQAPH
jgi:hypothetical protein